MLSRARFILPIPLAVLLGGLFTASNANVKYTKQEKKPCVTCHTSVQGKELNAVGKCYREKHSLVECAKK